MKISMASILLFILVAVLGSHAGLLQETIKERRIIHHVESPIVHLGFHDSSNCCFSYASRIPCSRFTYYFPTSGGCIQPGIIFITKRGTQVCARPEDSRVQECQKTLQLIQNAGNSAIA